MTTIRDPDWSQLSSLDGEQVRAFITVVDSGGVTAAARQMHRTQSTISLRIRTLEERLGTHLFLRDSRRLALSRDGENFLIHARRIIQVQNEAIAALKRTGSHGVIRFGLPEDYAELWLPDLLGKFYRLRPDARPHIDCRMSLELIERLQAGELDLALVVRHNTQSGGRHLGREDVVWAAHRDFVLPGGTSVPLALFRNLLLPSARSRGPGGTRAAVSRGLHEPGPTGIKVAVNHGAAVTIIDRCTLPENWRVLDMEDGLPALPPADLELLRAPGNRDPAADDLALLIEAMVEERARERVVARLNDRASRPVASGEPGQTQRRDRSASPMVSIGIPRCQNEIGAINISVSERTTVATDAGVGAIAHARFHRPRHAVPKLLRHPTGAFPMPLRCSPACSLSPCAARYSGGSCSSRCRFRRWGTPPAMERL